MIAASLPMYLGICVDTHWNQQISNPRPKLPDSCSMRAFSWSQQLAVNRTKSGRSRNFPSYSSLLSSESHQQQVTSAYIDITATVQRKYKAEPARLLDMEIPKRGKLEAWEFEA